MANCGRFHEGDGQNSVSETRMWAQGTWKV